MPSTLWEDLASGVGHPVIGLDHLGLHTWWRVPLPAWPVWAFFPAPVAFRRASLAGVGLHLALVDLPAVE